MPYETLKTIKPRKYQEEIYETCKENNCLVILPTGIGKTLIALMLAIHRQKKFPGSKILFLAPTRPLAEQHLHYFQKNLPEPWADMQLFTGKIHAEKRKEIWQTADIIFSTPQCIGNDLKNYLYDLNGVSLLIEDECHRCLKNYAYTYVAEKYKEQAENPRILGLTASPGADKQTISQIAKNLNINAIEIRTRDSEDVKEYLQELNINKITLDFPEEFQQISRLFKHIYDRKIEELQNRNLLFGPPTKKNLLNTQIKIMSAISRGNRHFNYLSGASACAQAIKIQHAIELIETQTLQTLYEYIQGIFEQAKQQKSKAVQQIIKQPEFNSAYIKLMELLAKKQEHPKLLETKKIILENIKRNPKFKAIVFSQYRSTVARICKELNEIPDIRAKVFIGQAKKQFKNILGNQEETGLSQQEQAEIIQKFKIGEINVISATSIGEEGLDIPEVNAVIFYEPVPSAIRKIQRAGRTARLMKGQLIMLVTKNTRDEAYYWAAFHKEKRMHSAIAGIKKSMEESNSKKPQETCPKKSNKYQPDKQKTLF